MSGCGKWFGATGTDVKRDTRWGLEDRLSPLLSRDDDRLRLRLLRLRLLLLLLRLLLRELRLLRLLLRLLRLLRLLLRLRRLPRLYLPESLFMTLPP